MHICIYTHTHTHTHTHIYIYIYIYIYTERNPARTGFRRSVEPPAMPLDLNPKRRSQRTLGGMRWEGSSVKRAGNNKKLITPKQIPRARVWNSVSMNTRTKNTRKTKKPKKQSLGKSLGSLGRSFPQRLPQGLFFWFSLGFFGSELKNKKNTRKTKKTKKQSLERSWGNLHKIGLVCFFGFP